MSNIVKAKKEREAKKAGFYNSLAGREYTISVLMEMHKLSRPTVSKWLQQANVPEVPGSWPKRYHLPGLITTDGKGSHVLVSPPSTELDHIPTEAVTNYLQYLLNPETTLDLADMFRKIKNAKDVQTVIKGLEDTLKVARYYDQFFIEDGLI